MAATGNVIPAITTKALAAKVKLRWASGGFQLHCNRCNLFSHPSKFEKSSGAFHAGRGLLLPSGRPTPGVAAMTTALSSRDTSIIVMSECCN
jgi:hypothetical protein